MAILPEKLSIHLPNRSTTIRLLTISTSQETMWTTPMIYMSDTAISRQFRELRRRLFTHSAMVSHTPHLMWRLFLPALWIPTVRLRPISFMQKSVWQIQVNSPEKRLFRYTLLNHKESLASLQRSSQPLKRQENCSRVNHSLWSSHGK